MLSGGLRATRHTQEPWCWAQMGNRLKALFALNKLSVHFPDQYQTRSGTPASQAFGGRLSRGGGGGGGGAQPPGGKGGGGFGGGVLGGGN